uniref:BLOC-1-related complex subunit 5 n=1 Tax=Strongyloides stercoralis TaxID=6248 RepID=A0A0K0DV04_STRER
MSDKDSNSVALTEITSNHSVTVKSDGEVEANMIRRYTLESIKNQLPDENCHQICSDEITRTSSMPLQSLLQLVIDNQNYYSSLYLKCIEESTNFINQLKASTNVLIDSSNLEKEKDRIMKEINSKNIINNNNSDCKTISEYVENIYEEFEISQKKYEDVKNLTDSLKNLLNILE